MLRVTSKKNENSFNVSLLNSSSITNLSTIQTMEKQIDNYTRKLQQDKRKFFRVQQNFSEIKKELGTKSKQLQKLKSRKSKTQLITLKGKIITLEATLDQTINSYNQALSKNNKLKLEIDELRKQKKNQLQNIKFLTDKVESFTQQIGSKQDEIEQKKSTIQKIKEQIIKAKQTNEEELKSHEQKVCFIKKNFAKTGREDERRKQKGNENSNTQNIDTQPLLKLRLKNLIAKNKQKIKIIDQYKKNMHLIYQNFQQIKEESGIQDLEEITKTFLKQQDQNLFIYQYISILNSNIQCLQESNQEIKKKISQQQEINRERRIDLAGTPEEAKRKRQFQSYKQEKLKRIYQLNECLEEIKPKMYEILRFYNLIEPNNEVQISQGNIQMFLSQIQELINNSNTNFEVVYKSDFKQDITRYTKLPPMICQEQKQKPQQKLLEKQKLKQIAGQYWQKKKSPK